MVVIRLFCGATFRMKCIKIIYAAIMNITVALSVILSNKAITVTPILKRVQVPEFQIEIK